MRRLIKISVAAMAALALGQTAPVLAGSGSDGGRDVASRRDGWDGPDIHTRRGRDANDTASSDRGTDDLSGRGRGLGRGSGEEAGQGRGRGRGSDKDPGHG